jgi:signal transduction histidine kinase
VDALSEQILLEHNFLEMLHEFLTANKADLVARCRAKVAQRPSPEATKHELEHGIPLFLGQLITTLKMEQTSEPILSRKVSGMAGGQNSNLSEIGETAGLHGNELLLRGFTVEQVVHDYGDLCQAITDLAFQRKASIEIDEFRTLNRCLDNAIADAVTEFTYQRDIVVADKEAKALNVRLGILSHELRGHLNTATLALHSIRAGDVGLNGATGAILDSSLVEMTKLINRSLSEVRMTAGLESLHHSFSVADFIAEVKLSASLQAQVKRCHLIVGAVDPHLVVDVDRDLLHSALGNLLQNAFKFTRSNTEVTLNAYATGDRILIDVKDNCGGLPEGDAENMFEPFSQKNEDKSGVGLGLSIARRGVEANGGILSVRDMPGIGCVFTIDLPRHTIPFRSAPAKQN